jgi:hypothetical protein
MFGRGIAARISLQLRGYRRPIGCLKSSILSRSLFRSPKPTSIPVSLKERKCDGGTQSSIPSVSISQR